MPNISGYTLAQIRAATKAQIVTALTNQLNSMTKRQIILFLWDTIDRVPDNTVFVTDAQNRVISQTDIDRDIETGVMVGGRVVTSTFYPTGEVDTITISTRNASNAEIAKKIIKHYKDGSQPTVS
jgi:hypothetical protein